MRRWSCNMTLSTGAKAHETSHPIFYLSPTLKKQVLSQSFKGNKDAEP